MTAENGLGDRALSWMAQLGLSFHLNEADALDIEVEDGSLLELLQGKVSGIHIRARGLVASQDLRLESLQLDLDGVAIAPLGVAAGKIELTQPTEIGLRLGLTAADLNGTLNSPLVEELLAQMPIPFEDERFYLQLDRVECQLPGDEKLYVDAVATVVRGDRRQTTAFELVLSVDQEQRLVLERGGFCDNRWLPFSLTTAILSYFSSLLRRTRFRYQNLNFYVRSGKVEIGQEQVGLQARVQIMPFSLAELGSDRASDAS